MRWVVAAAAPAGSGAGVDLNAPALASEPEDGGDCMHQQAAVGDDNAACLLCLVCRGFSANG